MNSKEKRPSLISLFCFNKTISLSWKESKNSSNTEDLVLVLFFGWGNLKSICCLLRTWELVLFICLFQNKNLQNPLCTLLVSKGIIWNQFPCFNPPSSENSSDFRVGVEWMSYFRFQAPLFRLWSFSELSMKCFVVMTEELIMWSVSVWLRKFISACLGAFIICSSAWRGSVPAGKNLCGAKPAPQWTLWQAAAAFFLQSILMVMRHGVSHETLLVCVYPCCYPQQLGPVGQCVTFDSPCITFLFWSVAFWYSFTRTKCIPCECTGWNNSGYPFYI